MRKERFDTWKEAWLQIICQLHDRVYSYTYQPQRILAEINDKSEVFIDTLPQMSLDEYEVIFVYLLSRYPIYQLDDWKRKYPAIAQSMRDRSKSRL